MKRVRRGFTLIEVLIALAVVALAMLGLTRVATMQVRDFDALRERTLAGWVAANVLEETRIAVSLPATGRSNGRVEFASRAWRWTRDVSATPDPQLRRIDVQVFTEDTHEPVASLAGFAGNSLQP